jgi:dipeptidyl aminopeptidase/acylaminoacyl peptidase
MKTFVLFFLFFRSIYAFPQNPTRLSKPQLDTSAFTNWPFVKGSGITNDGKYIYYKIQRCYKGPQNIILQSLDGKWKMEIANSETVNFGDNENAICFRHKDTLCLIRLGSDSINYIPNVNSFQLFKNEIGEWLIYRLNNLGKNLILKNLRTQDTFSFFNVSAYLISTNGASLIIKEELNHSSSSCKIIRVDLLNNLCNTIWTGDKVSSWVLDSSGSQLSFIEQKNDSISNLSTDRALWYYKVGETKAIQLTKNYPEGFYKNLQLNEVSSFSKDGSKLFITLKEIEVLNPKPKGVKVDVWSYTDVKLQSRQLAELGPKTYEAVFNLESNKVIRLQYEDDVIPLISIHNPKNDDYKFLIHSKGDDFEAHWNSFARSKCFIVSTSTGERKSLDINFRDQSFSPEGKYLVGCDETWKDFYSFELKTGIIHNLTKKIAIPITPIVKRDRRDRPYYKNSRGFSLAAWLPNEEAILVYDDFDIWKLDPTGKNSPINLTNGYGRKNKIIFRLISLYLKEPVNKDKSIILSAFNEKNKKSGFYRITANKQNDPQLLSMDANVYDRGGLSNSYQKAKNAEIYLLISESTTQSPNLFWTKDFKHFQEITFIHPEQKYNWMTSELHSFKTVDGRVENAILYKPENFDPRRKYPVIINYYERKSQDLNKFHELDPIEGGHGDLDISWFVSHEYLVFTPDIHYVIGNPGISAYNSIVGAAKYIAKFPWVNRKCIGIQGQSFGAYETNYVITHSNNLFAAAVSSSGECDFISSYGSLRGTISNQYFMEIWQDRMGVTLWDNPQLYINNSPIFNANRIEIPLLTISNKSDLNVPFSQGLELFLALRRLGKRAWMLQYDGQSHGLDDKNCYKDYIIRMTQFFDHYLKNMSPPKWMMEGIPAKLKGIETGLELDLNKGATPRSGLNSSQIN